ncbi:TolC family protein [Olivibacter ginsenosidimutans]|uniref:TolC family protein n=1 Tax=Olivibacter ginsenosidimutans TaxID=1176537 RepID=A0ABP9CGA2_9SPHI
MESLVNVNNICFARYIGIMGLLLTSHFNALAQDSLRLSLAQAEQLFIAQNLSLLAQQYHIDLAKASVIQAKLFNNPTLQFTLNAYNPENRRFFDTGKGTGQYVVDIQQLIRLAGKRNKEVALAETDVMMEESRFFDLLRSLRFSLRSDFYQSYFLQHTLAGYVRQINNLERLHSTYQQLLAKGVVTLKDAARIKTMLYARKAEYTSLQGQLLDVNAELQLLIHNNKAWIIPIIDTTRDSHLGQYALADLLDSAMANRQDLRLAQQSKHYSDQNYALQKAMAIPDLTIGAEFDKRGSSFDNATLLSVAIDLPFFNRNQGNIKAAKLTIAQAKTELEQQQEKVENEVQNAYAKAIQADKLVQAIEPHFMEQLEHLLQSVTDNFQNKNISLLEFVDFYDSYKDNMVQLNQLQNEKMQALEALQFAVGTTIFY